MADYDERLRQAQELARLLGQPPAQTWTQQRALMVRMRLDEPDDWSVLLKWAWMALLEDQPQLADRVPDWKSFNVLECWDLVLKQPQLLSWMSPDWKHLDPWRWALLLREHPQLADQVPDWKAFDADDCYTILLRQPQLLSRMSPDWHRLSDRRWAELLQLQQQLAKIVPESIWSRLFAHEHTAALCQGRLPEYAQKAP